MSATATATATVIEPVIVDVEYDPRTASKLTPLFWLQAFGVVRGSAYGVIIPFERVPSPDENTRILAAIDDIMHPTEPLTIKQAPDPSLLLLTDEMLEDFLDTIVDLQFERREQADDEVASEPVPARTFADLWNGFRLGGFGNWF